MFSLQIGQYRYVYTKTQNFMLIPNTKTKLRKNAQQIIFKTPFLNSFLKQLFFGAPILNLFFGSGISLKFGFTWIPYRPLRRRKKFFLFYFVESIKCSSSLPLCFVSVGGRGTQHFF